MADDGVEQTLGLFKAVSVYRIPPRPGVQGWRSGEWLMSDKLFSGRMRIVARGDLCEIRLEDVSSGELFATCPVPYGQRSVCVESVTDSSRYYVLRVADPASGRHAFLGMGFDNRTDAFDFNESLVRHEQYASREHAMHDRQEAAPGAAAAAAASTSGTSPGSAPAAAPGSAPWGSAAASAHSSAAAEVEALHRHSADLRLGQGQTIRVNLNGLKKPGGPPAGSFLGGAAATLAGPGPGLPAPGGGLQPPILPPPPVPRAPEAPAWPQQPGPLFSVAGAQPQPGGGAAAAGGPPGLLAGASQQPQPAVAGSGQAAWATFE